MKSKLLRDLRSVWSRGRMEREMDAELRFHLEHETEENIRRGMNPADARAAALRSFGGVEQTKEACRDERGGRWLGDVRQDLRYGFNLLRRNPGFALVAVLTLALGIGANTAIFSVIYGVLLRPLPYQNGERLLALKQQAPLAGIDSLGFSVKEIADYRAQSQTLDELVEYHAMAFTLFGHSEPERVQTAVVSANFFDVLGVQPKLGRGFLPDDEQHGAEAVLILSHDYWERSHHGDPNIVGKVFQMNNRPHTVIGVLPPIPEFPNKNDVYMATSACPTRSSEGFKENRRARMMTVFGRLKSGISQAQAQADLSAIAARIKQEHPADYPASNGYQLASASLREVLTKDARPTFLILLGTAGLVLLIACANVANLTLARVMRREREMAVRAALGASRGRLIRQLLTESALLSLTGGLLGILLAAFSLNLLVDFAARFTPRAGEITLNGSVLLFTLLVSVLTGLLFGLVPALSTGVSLTSALKEGGQTTVGVARQRLRGALVVGQVALSFMLLVGAGLTLRSFLKLQQVSPGFDPERVVVMRLSPNWSKYTTNQQYQDFSLRVLDVIKSVPGVQSAAIAGNYPLNPQGIARGPNSRDFIIEGRPVAESELAPQADVRIVSPDYLQTLRQPLISGRFLSEADGDKAARAVVVNQTLARHRWGNENPVGRRISLDRGETWVTVVGVIGDSKNYGLNQEAVDELYAPVAQTSGGGFLLARTAAEPMGVVRQLRNAVYRIDGETAIDHVRTLEEARSEALASPRLTALLLGLFALLALVITATGLAGVMALLVNQRTHELGIRLVLGAAPGKILMLVLRQGLVLVALGLALGFVGALALRRVMAGLLFAVEPGDPLTWLGVSLVLTLVAAAACFLPARRVTLIDPLPALRSE
ncbi:MAG TPA: ABC transporter permease [Blastocatellia bacterium]|nr:ABC transporter permease [Blastocatellia bacterium]HMY70675.1 ABC transporter permease [Blastocatellia bacterium]HMZ19774.1 ABC transporter permease [Blastocatellia bacterium]HNG31758.1 ABC transporter permease [Blastocatellia bacterium]